MSFSSPRFGKAIRFVQQVGERYKDRQNAGHLLAIAPLVTREAEIAYAHDRLEDYNAFFVQEFRAWLEGRYQGDIGKLNAAWGTQHRAFADVPAPRTFSTPAGRDWYRFRDLKARQFVDSCAAALAAIPGLKEPYRLLLDYGNVGDPMAWKRGSLSFGFHAAQPAVWGVKHNDAHDYNQAYTGSLLGSTMRQMGKVAFNEWFYDRNKERYPGKDVDCRQPAGDQGPLRAGDERGFVCGGAPAQQGFGSDCRAAQGRRCLVCAGEPAPTRQFTDAALEALGVAEPARLGDQAALLRSEISCGSEAGGCGHRLRFYGSAAAHHEADGVKLEMGDGDRLDSDRRTRRGSTS